MLLHQKIRKWREAQDLKQQSVADALGITQPAYSDIENGKTKPSAAQKEILAKLFEVPISQFYADDEYSAHAFMLLQKDNEYLKEINAELRNEIGLYKKIVELQGGKEV